MAPSLVVDLAAPGAAVAELVGGKGAGLARLHRLGLPVPRSVAVTTESFRIYCEHNRIDRAGARSEVARAIRTGDWPPDLREAVARALEEIPGGVVAVRSSATCEDGERFSMAGQFATFLSVDRVDVPSRIAASWASLFEGPARAYLDRMRTGAESMAVVLQEQVHPTWSGVAFSLDPVSRSFDGIAMEWVEGSGVELVQGRVTPRRLSLSRHARAVDGDVPAALAPHLLALRHHLERLERDAGRPVDVEWCATPERLTLLQVRPVTSAFGPGDVLWSNVNLAENFPAPLAPLAWSVLHRFYGEYVRSLLRGLGMGRRMLAEVVPDAALATGIHRGRVHYDLTGWYTAIDHLPWSEALGGFLDGYIGQDVPIRPPPVARPGEQGRRRVVGKARFVAFSLATVLLARRRLRALERRLRAERREWRTTLREATDPRDAERIVDRAMSLVGESWGGPCGADLGVGVVTGVLGALVERWCRRSRADVMPTLLQGVAVRSDEPTRLLWRLSRASRRRDGGIAPDHESWRAGLDADEARILEEFLERYGARCYADCSLSSPTFEERPDLVFELVRSFAALPDAMAPHVRAGAAAERERLVGELTRDLGPVRSALFRAVHGWSLRTIQRREEGRLLQSFLFGEIRVACLRIGALLVAGGGVRAPEDVFDLTWEEVRDLARGAYPYPECLPALRAARRNARIRAASSPPPSLFLLRAGDSIDRPDGPAAAGRVAAPAGRALAGVAVSRGRVRGKARVVRDPLHETLAPGEILVAESTDPGWTPLVFLAGGLVLERGGMLSHGAIVAREVGIPGLVQVEGACARIASGDELLVDANAGTVVVEPPHG